MKLIVIGLFCTIVAVQAGISKERKIIMRGFSKVCSETNGVSDDVISEIRKGDYEQHIKDPKVNQFSFCMLQKMGVVNEKGALTKDIVLSLFDADEKPGISDALDECQQNVEGKIDDKNAAEFSKCYHEKYPDHIVI